jgi:hypothetical protein
LKEAAGDAVKQQQGDQPSLAAHCSVDGGTSLRNGSSASCAGSKGFGSGLPPDSRTSPELPTSAARLSQP